VPIDGTERKEYLVRRERTGLLLPGIVLTVLACVGVIVLVASATGVLPDEIPVLRAADGAARRSTDVSAPPATPRPSAAASPTASPSPSATPSTRTRDRSRPVAGPTVAPTTAAPAACKAGSATVTAVADTYVDQSQPAKNFGRERTLVARSRKDRNSRVLVRFALPVVPKGCTVRGGTLTMTARDATGRKLVAAPASRGWSESSVTWSSAPAPGGGVSATASSARVVWSFSAATVTGARNGFVVRDAAEDAKGSGVQTGFASRDGSGAPTLTIRWS